MITKNAQCTIFESLGQKIDEFPGMNLICRIQK